MKLQLETIEDLAKLPMSYLQKVHENMVSGGSKEKTTVRLGLSGCGERPNYELTYGIGEKVAFNSSNHEHYSRSKTFNEENISRPFSYDELKAAFNRSVLG
ncbi:hypothetical protein A9267_10865 [Shewanella sp. UCD-FRSSP16_17]|uniref:hypothetical protein n=1 Tax=Shewanella sp. UCD-FRSSP16_17 TaxID=1853256 RepID=UPI0007EEC777|nr:hypothetical protein [Shewanella sp. UCD-FRSSP16_17]OBT08212.1 hypothetical protein A9267_10865 [Shewanella sp. UCD-FRSSP16_17]